MSKLESTSNLKGSVKGFDEMINQFGVVTVMNAKVFTKPLGELLGGKTAAQIADMKAHDIVKLLVNNENYIFIDSLKIANINVEGPSKTVTGGQYANPLIKFGKTATIEMQDALGRANVLEAFGGAVVEQYEGIGTEGNRSVVHVTQDFVGPVTILGESFFIEQKTGTQVPVQIVLYQMLPDAIFNLTQDSEGDATVFDLNGSLLATTITIGDEVMGTDGLKKGVFYSVLPIINYDKPAGAPFTVQYLARTSNGAEQGVLDALNDPQQKTDNVGGFTLPSITGYEFYDAITDGQKLQGAVELKSGKVYVGKTE